MIIFHYRFVVTIVPCESYVYAHCQSLYFIFAANLCSAKYRGQAPEKPREKYKQDGWISWYEGQG